MKRDESNVRNTSDGKPSHSSHSSHSSHASAPLLPPRGDYQTLLSFQKRRPPPIPQHSPGRMTPFVSSGALRKPASQKLFHVLYEDPELLVINKPAGLVCHPTKTDELSSLISRVRLYLGEGSHPQLVNRLDRETSGVTLIAKDAVSARRLRRLWEQRQVRKEYLAIVHGWVSETHGIIEAPLGKDEHSLVAIKDCVRSDGSPARTEYWVERTFSRERPDQRSEAKGQKPDSKLASSDQLQPLTCNLQPFTLLRVEPHTGRKHQIRIHLAHIGHPLVGDKLYGGDEDLYLALVEDRLTPGQKRKLMLPHHALHAREVQFTWRGLEAVFRAEPEPWFSDFALQ